MTRDRGYIIAGYTSSIRNNQDFYLIKADAKFNFEWGKTFGGNELDRAYAAIQTLDGGYAIVGTVGVTNDNDDIFICKTDAIGKLKWTQRFGGALKDDGRSIKELPNGNLIVLGTIEEISAGNTNIALFMLTPSGDTIWTRTYGAFGAETAAAMDITLDGFIITGYTENYGATFYDMFLLKTDQDGRQEWLKIYGDINRDEGHAVIASRDGGYAVVGTANIAPRFRPVNNVVYFFKTDGNGELQWTKKIDVSISDEGFDLLETDDGYLIVGATLLEAETKGNQLYLIRTNANGDSVWTKLYGGFDTEVGYSIHPAGNHYVIAGYTQSYGAGNSDVYLLKVDENGEIQK
ncbi:hypothetical protein HUU42_09035 [bacterium]|nr:hypothetical protein [bacterium]